MAVLSLADYTRNMKTQAVRFAPMIFGFLMIWFLIDPPAFFDQLGRLRFLIVGISATLAFLAFIALVISKSLPADVVFTEVDEDAVIDEMSVIVKQLEALSFSRAPSPLEVGVAPPAILVPMVDDRGLIYATIYRTGTVPARVAWNLVSILEGFQGGLTSMANPDGASLPGSPGSLRQVLPDETPEELHLHHKLAMSHVSGHSLSWKRLSLSEFEADFRSSINHERAAFYRHPWLYPPVALWRAVTKRSPHLGPIAHQEVAARTLREIQEGRVRPAIVRPIG